MDNIKKHQIGLRLNDEELQRLHRLAVFFGLKHHEAIRMLLKIKTDELLGTSRPGAR